MLITQPDSVFPASNLNRLHFIQYYQQPLKVETRHDSNNRRDNGYKRTKDDSVCFM